MAYDEPRCILVSTTLSVRGYVDYDDAHGMPMSAPARAIRGRAASLGDDEHSGTIDWVRGGLLTSPSFGWGLWGCGGPTEGCSAR